MSMEAGSLRKLKLCYVVGVKIYSSKDFNMYTKSWNNSWPSIKMVHIILNGHIIIEIRRSLSGLGT